MKKIKYWLWYFFGKRNYTTIWKKSCTAFYRNNLTGFTAQIPATAIVKYDSERKLYHSYLSNGSDQTDVELAVLVAENPDLVNVLEQYNISY